jgi:ABC-type dipeptide/oligopeptide/nickel transport system permease subunit
MGDKSMATYKSRLSFRFKRLKSFLNTFKASKRGMFGIAILIFFGVLAVGAPLLTPYDPLRSTNLAGSSDAPAMPSWVRYLPGGGSLSENLEPIVDPYFSSLDSLKEWNISVVPYVSNALVEQIPGISVTKIGTQDGSLAVTYNRRGRIEAPIEFKVTISKKFNYPYNGPPARFMATMAMLFERLNNVTVRVSVFVQQGWLESKTPDTFQYTRFEWGTGKNGAVETFSEATLTSDRSYLSWVYPKETIGFQDSKNVARAFPKSGDYYFGVEISFTDLRSTDNAKATIFLDNLDIRLYGTAFGLLGTTKVGQDLFSQLAYGARVSLLIGLLASLLSIVIGLFIGLISAYLGGFADELLMRLTDAMLVLPTLPLLIVLMTVMRGASMEIIIILVGVLGWMGFARVVRSQVLSIKERPYIEAAKAVGAGTAHILTQHIIPNVMSLVYVTLAMSVPSAIVTEAALSWLGYRDVNRISWGRILFEVRDANAYRVWWWVIPPGLSIALVSLSFILLGYALDEILNPKLRLRR